MSEQELTKKIVTEVFSKINKTLYGIAIGVLGVFLVVIFFVITAFSSHGKDITTNTVTNKRQDLVIEKKADADVVDMIYKALTRIEGKIDEK